MAVKKIKKRNLLSADAFTDIKTRGQSSALRENEPSIGLQKLSSGPWKRRRNGQSSGTASPIEEVAFVGEQLSAKPRRFH